MCVCELPIFSIIFYLNPKTTTLFYAISDGHIFDFLPKTGVDERMHLKHYSILFSINFLLLGGVNIHHRPVTNAATLLSIYCCHVLCDLYYDISYESVWVRLREVTSSWIVMNS